MCSGGCGGTGRAASGAPGAHASRGHSSVRYCRFAGLGRAAGLIGAKGLTIWIADPTGRLYPGAAHGYPPEALSRLGSLDPTADNATAAAYRTSSTQTVAGDARRSGALVVPLMGVGGCVGVLAAEMEHGRERADGVRAVTRIVAAQLATLIPGAAETHATEAPVARAESG